MDQPIKKRQKVVWVVIVGFLTLSFLSVLGAFFYFRFSSTPGRTNLLLLGISGENYTAGDLTDTIIFISLDHQTGKILTLSLPRDIWITPLRTKLNSVYHYGGFDLAKTTVAEILGQPVDYVLLIDANLFVKIIDFLGGVEVEVERSFDDYRYPLAGKENDDCGGDPEYRCRYEHLHFEAGRQHMDGQRALKYVRSRFAEGEEGTDFARSQRQRRLLLAVKNKILSPQFIFRPLRLVQLFKLISLNIQTDIPHEKYFDFFKIALKFRSKKLKALALSNDFLINPPSSKEKYDNQWVLVPRAGDWKEIQEEIKKLLADKP